VSRDLRAFVTDFVVPLLAGADVWVGKPLRPRDRDEWASSLGAASLPDVNFWRLRRAQLLTAQPELPEPDVDELSLWIGLHNLLVFEHPDRTRVWAREITWRRLEGATRTLLTLPSPEDTPTLVARHLSVGAFIDLLRAEVIVATPIGEVRLPALESGRRFLRGASGPAREQSVPWLPQPHAPEVERLIEDALRSSPLTCLLRPNLAPGGWSPLLAAELLLQRPWARAVCHAWATQKDWMLTGGAVMSALLPSLPRLGGPPPPAGTLDSGTRPALPEAGAPLALPGAVVPCDPQALGAIVGALIHLHLLKVLELDTRVGLALGSREPGVLAFLALPLLLPHLSSELGEPVPAVAEDATSAPVVRRWTEYVDHLAELVPRSVVENLLATLVGRIVKPA
jgi:hypothetical protein